MVYLIDTLLVITLVAAICLGATRSWKVSFSSCLAHLSALVVTWLLTVLLARPLATMTAPYLKITEWLPASIGFWLGPFEANIRYTLIFVFLFISFFMTSKSIFHAFSWTYEWGDILFRKIRLPRVIDGFFSIVFTAIHAGTWLWAMLVVVAFPFFNIRKNASLTGLVMEIPLLQEQIATVYLPYEEIQTVIALIGDNWLELWDGSNINQEVFAGMAPEEVRQLQYDLIGALSDLPPEFNELIHQLLQEIQ